jgi:methylated-DNA-[protein]-cysteine S-methyltransferase
VKAGAERRGAAASGLARRTLKLGAFGAVTVIASDTALVGVVFGGEPSRRWAGAVTVAAAGKHAVLDRAAAALVAWAAAEDGADTLLRALPCDLSSQTRFTQAVLAATRAIPRGAPGSYGSVAKAIGNPGAARAVGGALGRNPIPIVIPCHRVLAGDGRIGGFTGGLAIKRTLLKLERTAVVGVP